MVDQPVGIDLERQLRGARAIQSDAYSSRYERCVQRSVFSVSGWVRAKRQIGWKISQARPGRYMLIPEHKKIYIYFTTRQQAGTGIKFFLIKKKMGRNMTGV